MTGRAMGVVSPKQAWGDAHVGPVCEQAPANAPSRCALPDATESASGDLGGSRSARSPPTPPAREPTPPAMPPIEEDSDSQQLLAVARAERLANELAGRTGLSELDAPPPGSLASSAVQSQASSTSRFAPISNLTALGESPPGSGHEASGSLVDVPHNLALPPLNNLSSQANLEAAAAQKWLMSSVQSLVHTLRQPSPKGGILDSESSLFDEKEDDMVSPPLQPVRDFHTPRTDITKETFTLAAVGIVISMTEGDPAKTITEVQGGASIAGVRECDELVAIDGVDVSGEEVTGFDCVEICQQVLREGGRSVVTLGIRDFCSMHVNSVDVDVSGGCPARRLLRERNSPLTLRSSPLSVRVSPSPVGLHSSAHRRPSPLVTPLKVERASSGAKRSSSAATARLHSPEDVVVGAWGHANLDDRPYMSSRPSSLTHSPGSEEDVIIAGHSTPGHRRLSPQVLLEPSTSADCSDGEVAVGQQWTWSVPGRGFGQFVGVLLLVVLGAGLYVQSVGKEETLLRMIGAIDWLEAGVQQLPLCPCTYWIRGSIVTVPLCRVCKQKVLRYHNYNNVAGMAGSDKRGKGVCDLRPAWLMGKCTGSTDSTKYLGTFGSYEECEAACLSYNVGRDRCRALTYFGKTYKHIKFRQTCFALTHTGWSKVREFGVTTGRVLGPLSHLQRGLQFLKQELRRRLLVNWWDTGSPGEVLLTVVLFVFGLSGIRRTTTVDAGGAGDTD